MEAHRIQSDVRRTVTRRLTRFTGRRLVWISMLLLHLAPLRAIGLELANDFASILAPAMLFRVLSLLALTSFFALKVTDAPWLRLPPGWRNRVIAVLIIGLLHAGVVERVVAGESDISPVQFGLMLSAAAASKAEAAQRRLDRWLACITGPSCGSNCRSSLLAKLEHERTPRFHFLPAFARLRAPPVIG